MTIWDITQIYFTDAAVIVLIYNTASKFVLILQSNSTVRPTGVLMKSLTYIAVGPIRLLCHNCVKIYFIFHTGEETEPLFGPCKQYFSVTIILCFSIRMHKCYYSMIS